MLPPQLKAFLTSLDTSTITAERKIILHRLVDFIREKIDERQAVQLLFVCTHNSRRSQLAQVWAQTIAYYLRIPRVQTYSGGTTVTAVYPEVLNALTHVGFHIESSQPDTPNAKYNIEYAPEQMPLVLFSKEYTHGSNPQSQFAAIMTCDRAATDCPMVPGAESRIALTYRDPKEFDQLPVCAEEYQQTSRLIATELLYVFSQINIVQ